MKLKKLYDKVEWCLKNYPDTRNSDIKLTIKIWENFDHLNERLPIMNVTAMENLLLDSAREDNVKRIRATIQNKERRLVPTDWKVAQARGFRIKGEWEKFLGYDRDSQIILAEGRALDKAYEEKIAEPEKVDERQKLGFDLPSRMY